MPSSPLSSDLEAQADALAARLERLGDGALLLVLTGAGVSVASGIPTFRGDDPGAIWKRDVTELGTHEYFQRDPAGSWQWYLARFDKVLDARPNEAHRAIAALERWQEGRGGRFLLVTQNIDTLHEQAGSREMVKVHGTADRVRCDRDGCEMGAPRGSIARREIEDAMTAFRADPRDATVPRCPACGSIMRQHVLWFDEYYQSHEDYRWDDVGRAIDRMHLALCVGTSFSVGVTEMVLRAALWSGVPLVSIDPNAAFTASRGVDTVAAPAEALLPAVCARLGVKLPATRP